MCLALASDMLYQAQYPTWNRHSYKVRGGNGVKKGGSPSMLYSSVWLLCYAQQTSRKLTEDCKKELSSSILRRP